MKRVLVAGLALLVAVAALALTGCGGGGGGGSSESPEQVVEKFLSAAMEENADAAYELISAASKEAVPDKEDLVAGFSSGIEGYQVGTATVSGDKARVAVSFDVTIFEGELSFDMILVQEGGAWKISMAETNAETQKAMEELMKDFQPPQ